MLLKLDSFEIGTLQIQSWIGHSKDGIDLQASVVVHRHQFLE